MKPYYVQTRHTHTGISPFNSHSGSHINDEETEAEGLRPRVSQLGAGLE